jgi:hypothetical protein
MHALKRLKAEETEKLRWEDGVGNDDKAVWGRNW